MTYESGKVPAQKQCERGMVHSIKLENFKAFADAELEGFALINMIVGDNGVGKTSLMEGLHLALSGTPTAHLSSRAWRGFEAKFDGFIQDIEANGTYADLFRDRSKDARISLETLEPESRRYENRSLRITKSKDVVFQLDPTPDGVPNKPESVGTLANPVIFIWTDSNGKEYPVRTFIRGNQVTIQGTGEGLPNCSYFAVTNPISAAETASKFTALRLDRKDKGFKAAFRKVFDFVEDISAESISGESILMADLGDRMLPFALLSGGVNRTAAILLSIAQRQDGIVMVDESESGIYHRRLQDYARALISTAREYRTQLFLTTHSQEWLKHFITAAGEKVDDIAFWRMERSEGGAQAERFTGRQLFNAMNQDIEVR